MYQSNFIIIILTFYLGFQISVGQEEENYGLLDEISETFFTDNLEGSAEKEVPFLVPDGEESIKQKNPLLTSEIHNYDIGNILGIKDAIDVNENDYVPPLKLPSIDEENFKTGGMGLNVLTGLKELPSELGNKVKYYREDLHESIGDIRDNLHNKVEDFRDNVLDTVVEVPKRVWNHVKEVPKKVINIPNRFAKLWKGSPTAEETSSNEESGSRRNGKKLFGFL